MKKWTSVVYESIIYCGIKSINNLLLAGNDHFTNKEASGHKTDIAFQRYNLVTEEEMKGMKWLDLKQGTYGTMDTYMDTIAKTRIV